VPARHALDADRVPGQRASPVTPSISTLVATYELHTGDAARFDPHGRLRITLVDYRATLTASR
jgi:hypothetical protein